MYLRYNRRFNTKILYFLPMYFKHYFLSKIHKAGQSIRETFQQWDRRSIYYLNGQHNNFKMERLHEKTSARKI